MPYTRSCVCSSHGAQPLIGAVRGGCRGSPFTPSWTAGTETAALGLTSTSQRRGRPPRKWCTPLLRPSSSTPGRLLKRNGDMSTKRSVGDVDSSLLRNAEEPAAVCRCEVEPACRPLAREVPGQTRLSCDSRERRARRGPAEQAPAGVVASSCTRVSRRLSRALRHVECA